VPDELFRDNLNWLERCNPVLAGRIAELPDSPIVRVTPARSGAMTLAVNDLQLHSAYDPGSEAVKLAVRALESVRAGSVVVLLGVGLGHLALAIRERWSGALVVIEPDVAILRAAMQYLPLAQLGEAVIIATDKPPEAMAVLAKPVVEAGGWGKVVTVEHPPSLKLAANFFDGVTAGIRGRASNDTGPLGVLVVTPMYGGSLPIAKYCASAFERLGHRVEMLDNSIFDPARKLFANISRDRSHRGALERMLTALMSEAITARALDRAVDLVWLVAQSPMTVPVATELKKQGIPTGYWFVEEWQLLTYWQEWAPLFDYFFTIQRGSFLKALCDRGVRHAQHLPLAADPNLHRPLKLSAEELAEFGSETSHVGAGYRNRRHVFSGLAGFDFKLWGSDWDEPGLLSRVLQRDGARISTEDAVKIFNATAVNLNLHSSQFHDGVNPDGDYLNPRTYELAAAGAFQLVDHRSDLGEQFEPGKEIVTFTDAREIGPQIRYYLDHPDERMSIAEAARVRVLRDHTYDQRMTAAIEYIFGHETSRAGRRNPNHIENLIADAKDRPDLLALLGKMRGQGVVTLDDVIEQIRLNEGDLSEAETIFLLMFEFRKWAAEKDLV